jgi:succinate dehydrogenase / fumarate reductase, flavoprotein subunit
LNYEEVDTSLIEPRPRLYGVAGGEAIEQAWKERAAAGTADGKQSPRGGNHV